MKDTVLIINTWAFLDDNLEVVFTTEILAEGQVNKLPEDYRNNKAYLVNSNIVRIPKMEADTIRSKML